MSYEPTRVVIPTGLDVIGLNLGMVRLQNEELGDYQRRLTLETNERSGPTEKEFIRALSRRVGLFDTKVFTVDVIRDSDGNPLAEDPYLEITSGFLRTYSDYENGTVDLEINLVDRDESYFLTDVATALGASTFFSVTTLDSDYDYYPTKNLRYGNTNVHVSSELLRSSHENRLANTLVRSIYPKAAATFITEVANLADINVSGDYYVDYVNGVLFSYELQGGFIAYNYAQFPYEVYWQAVRTYPLLDDDKRYSLYDTVISDDTGLPEHTVLNAEGAAVYNNVLAVHPLCWGE